jgi:hypothetical protein
VTPTARSNLLLKVRSLQPAKGLLLILDFLFQSNSPSLPRSFIDTANQTGVGGQMPALANVCKRARIGSGKKNSGVFKPFS